MTISCNVTNVTYRCYRSAKKKKRANWESIVRTSLVTAKSLCKKNNTELDSLHSVIKWNTTDHMAKIYAAPKVHFFQFLSSLLFFCAPFATLSSSKYISECVLFGWTAAAAAECLEMSNRCWGARTRNVVSSFISSVRLVSSAFVVVHEKKTKKVSSEKLLNVSYSTPHCLRFAFFDNMKLITLTSH